MQRIGGDSGRQNLIQRFLQSDGRPGTRGTERHTREPISKSSISTARRSATPAAGLTAKQVMYDPTLGDDGSLTGRR